MEPRKFDILYLMVQDMKVFHWKEEYQDNPGERFSSPILDKLYAKCNDKNTVFSRFVEYFNQSTLSRESYFQWFDFQFFEDRIEVSISDSKNYVRYKDDPKAVWWGKPDHEIKRVLESTVKVIGLPIDDFQSIYYVEQDGIKKRIYRDLLSERKFYPENNDPRTLE